jgi:tripartite-type tricarboxylate transporter receptor subunit TctC
MWLPNMIDERSGRRAMGLSRRRVLYLATSAAALPASSIAVAQTYPSRPVRWIVGAAAGSAPDTLARLIGKLLSERIGGPFVVDNRPGAGSNIAAEAVVRAPPDGYTLLFITSANLINATLYSNLKFNFIHDIAPVATIARLPNVMEVNPSFPANTVPEFIAYAKANSGKINMASAGTGTVSHVAGELFKMMAGVDMIHVPYRSGPPALSDLISGQVQVMFDSLPSSIAHIRAGKLRALAVNTATRSHVIPDVPTIGEFVPGYEGSALFGMGAPKDTPVEIVTKLNQEVNASLLDPTVTDRLTGLGTMIVAGSPTEYAKLIAHETEKWGQVVKFADLKVE